MNFKEFFELKEQEQIEESRFRGGAGGAFGRQSSGSGFDFSGRSSNSGTGGNHSRMSNQNQNYSDRVAYGKGVESKVIEALKQNGWEVRPASAQQDMYDKIDGFKIDNGASIPFQVKYRDSGDDILMELAKNFTPSAHINFNGRDMVGKSALYVCLNKAGNLIRVRSANEAKNTASNMANELVNENLKDKTQRVLTNSKGTVRITNDPATGVSKLMAYLNPNAFHTMKQDIRVSGIW